MKHITACLVLLSLSAGILRGQDAPAAYKVGIFLPLHLDSAFSETGAYRFGKGFPRQSLPGLEFYLGAELAIDSLQAERSERVDVRIYDIRSREGQLSILTRMPVMDSLDLIIGQVTGTEYLQLARIAREKDIPFVSATYPNDGGIKSSPQVFIANAKLNTHLLAMFNHILADYGGRNIVWLRRNNPADDRVAEVFRQLNAEKGNNLRIRTQLVPDTFSERHIIPLIDSNKQNLIISGSLDERFALRLGRNCLRIPASYPLHVVGMPTWEGISELRTTEFHPLSMEYSATLYRPRLDSWRARMEELYRKRTFSKPSDLVFRGFQTTYHFVGLLMKFGEKGLREQMNDRSAKGVSDFDFQPVRWSRSSETPDYQENKRIYLIRRQFGQTQLLN
ncbi:MAG: ABC transporter substrate-binding protein [Chitinophagaceae bacterium]|nr:ABC transporter substrate-binding protein [Chitinophagaceae bacterium]